MTSHPAHCPSCAQAIHFPVFHGATKGPAITSRVRCPHCHVSLRVRLNQLAARSSPDHPVRLEISRVSPRRQDSGFPGFDPSPSGDSRVSTAVCPHCRQSVTEYRFAAGAGFSIVTYHCAEHGDIIPPRGADVYAAPPNYA